MENARFSIPKIKKRALAASFDLSMQPRAQ
jgi:hypothetical protein